MPKPDVCMHVDLPLKKKKTGKSALGHQAVRLSQAAGPLGRHGPWAAEPRACF